LDVIQTVLLACFLLSLLYARPYSKAKIDLPIDIYFIYKSINRSIRTQHQNRENNIIQRDIPRTGTTKPRTHT
jgi:hypothetical protein